MNPLVSATAAFAGKELFRKLVNDLYDFLAEKTGHKINQWKAQRKIDTLYRKISQVRFCVIIFTKRGVSACLLGPSSRSLLSKEQLWLVQTGSSPGSSIGT
jgi:hypothetical protein